jgi:hypothetical protein
MIDLTDPSAVRAEAERRAARRSQGLPLTATADELEQQAREDDARQEKEIQWECVKFYRAHGCVVYETSQKRASRIAPGIPDLIVFHPRSGKHWYHEVKTPKGELRPDQKDFREQCLLTHVTHIVGGVAAAGLAIETLSTTAIPRGKRTNPQEG